MSIVKEVSIPSSFVVKNMKLASDTGAGEAKLFFGSTRYSEEYNQFFEFGSNYKYCFSKENFIEYLKQVKLEYAFQRINKYKNVSLATWEQNYDAISAMDGDSFQINLRSFSDTSRYYVRSDDDLFNKTFRSIVIPKLTKAVFTKNEENRIITITVAINFSADLLAETERVIDVENHSVLPIDDLGRILSDMYTNAKETGQVAAIHMFGLKYGDVILTNGYSQKNIISLAGINASYSVELGKGVNIYKSIRDNEYGVFFASEVEVQEDNTTSINYYTGYDSSEPRNLIVFGAPGTGKSFELNKKRVDLLGNNSEMNYERVTFHPDYTYANFVGTYKPVPYTDAEGKDAITYEYVPGPFMRVLVAALKNGRTECKKPYLLIIEEINRANVAAVFGDVFQLLDRDTKNVSEYPIQTSKDIRKYLANELGGQPDDYAHIYIPDNMFIWATMNSADQGVFPMDTAFKRRWDFVYLGINEKDADIRGKYVYLAADKSQKVEWNKLRIAINDFLAEQKINEDKQLGPYFIARSIVVPAGDEIDRDSFIEVFKNKVIMYLFEDAARQKRTTLFEGCSQTGLRYSDICKEFDLKGIGIFNQRIRSKTEPEEQQETQH